MLVTSGGLGDQPPGLLHEGLEARARKGSLEQRREQPVAVWSCEEGHRWVDGGVVVFPKVICLVRAADRMRRDAMDHLLYGLVCHRVDEAVEEDLIAADVVAVLCGGERSQ